MGDFLKTVNEVADFEIYTGTASPINFNGLVRHYYLRQGPNVADIQVNLVAKGHRKAQSHDIAKRVRPAPQEDRRPLRGPHEGGRSSPRAAGPLHPGGRDLRARLRTPARDRPARCSKIFEETPGVVDMDWYMEKEQTWYEIDGGQGKGGASRHQRGPDRPGRSSLP